LLFLSCCRDTNRVVEEVVVQFVQLSFINALDRTSIQCFQISSQGSLLHSFSLTKCWTRLNPLPSLWSFKSFISWWTSASGDLASDEMLLTNLLLMTSLLQEHLYFRCTFLQMLQVSFLLIPLLSFVLPEPYKDIKFLSMVLYTWTNISISNWQFLIPCYHQNSKGNVC